ncbi:Uncharacterised protein (plasmid) [Tsukamurella tyrosinosolvens]|uniref:Uncharacterized protein n=1 Tax=Tsukamurella tyrosinosolvens TaxID=57704 RepID=A0A1H4VJK8_TSUTY|nr:hypothetical protein [Tsukamurella tyrosinosolvens]SEC81279.1 hypothetical protein SAMN04489793_3252 [Tsukamurella tyrosinosolvens]VEH90471.1 Uncharacterised protein [Tsukamurella tyrosinosolvens]
MANGAPATNDDSQFCSYSMQRWEEVGGVSGPVLMCDVHNWPAASEVYDSEPGNEVGLCQQVDHEYHRGPLTYWDDAAAVRVEVPDRCECGDPIERCSVRAYVKAFREHVSARTKA